MTNISFAVFSDSIIDLDLEKRDSPLHDEFESFLFGLHTLLVWATDLRVCVDSLQQDSQSGEIRKVYRYTLFTVFRYFFYPQH